MIRLKIFFMFILFAVSFNALAENSVGPDSVAKWNTFGKKMMDENRIDDAIVSFKKTLELDPDNATAKASLNDCYLAKGMSPDGTLKREIEELNPAKTGMSREMKLTLLNIEILDQEDRKVGSTIIVLGAVVAESILIGWYGNKVNSTSNDYQKQLMNATTSQQIEDAAGKESNNLQTLQDQLLLGLAIGSLLEVVGIANWWDASNRLSVLRAKRYDFTFSPMPMSPSGKLLNGIALNIRFGGGRV